MKTALAACLTIVLAASAAQASAQSAKKEQLKQALKDTEPKGPWVYDEIATGFAKAKLAKKPVMLVFR